MLNKRNQHKARRKLINYMKKKKQTLTNKDAIWLLMILEMLMFYNKGGEQ